ncbi:Carboxy-terminal processing protease CtpA [Acaryochloris thomasi RCC1774]|uniref:Carboxyl-terminal-processing protease n=1 Tax=Acaryochloris thomasi RCC1774 TaxID=1764569 RepID=A0A2W1JCE1_9CYAN|nr:carboxyl-terminal processing protease CtpA [Acaryochloris thomasi]PZD71623.1 Carboxy-terminal processing protease CtpA [Acaryochloris thomasi RCC1774]
MTKRFVCISLFLLYLFCAGLQSPALAFTGEQQLFNEAWQVVSQSYVDNSFNHQDWRAMRREVLAQPLNDSQQTYAAIQKMLHSLDDPFTRFLPPAQYESLQTSTAGELTGVGLQITRNSDAEPIEVISPIEGSPAAAADLQPADQILQIDQTQTKDLTLDQSAELMRGPVGSRVILKVRRPDLDKILEVGLTRDRIAINPVKSELKVQPDGSQVGYIRLRQFNANATREMEMAIRDLQRQGVIGYVLDLRNNPGGLLQAGVEIARLWLDPGPIVYTVDRQGIQGSFDAQASALTHTPLVVLVNRGSASASEILAGALQDTGRAQLIGEQTFGKGSIQSLFDLSDGSGLAVTIARYETPNHRNINKVGIKPDQIVKQSPITASQVATDVDAQYQAAVDVLRQPSAIASAA